MAALVNHIRIELQALSGRVDRQHGKVQGSGDGVQKVACRACASIISLSEAGLAGSVVVQSSLDHTGHRKPTYFRVLLYSN